MREIEHSFHERIISRDLWPARSPDMTLPLCDFYLWGRLKNAAYKTNLRTLEDWNVISVTKLITSIEENYSELWEIL